MHFSQKLLFFFALLSMTQAILPAQGQRTSATNADVTMATETSPTTEVAHLLTLTESQGDAKAQYNLGVSYFDNQGVPSTLTPEQRYTEAVRLWTLAANKGHAKAQCNLGMSYFDNQGVLSTLTPEQRYTEAVRLWTLAANQGLPEAQYNLGMSYFDNQGVPSTLTLGQRYTEAVRLWTLAAKKGDVEAQYNLGMCYINNQGVPSTLTKKQRHAKAVRFLKLAAKKELAGAQYNLGVSYFCNQGVPANLTQEQRYAEAIRLLVLAAGQGHEEAAWLLARCFINGTGVSRDYNKALTLYEQSLQKSDEIRLSLFYKMYKKRFLPQCSGFEKLANHCFNTLADRVNPEIQGKLAREKRVNDLIEATKIESYEIGDIDYATELCPVCLASFEVNQKIMLFSNNAKSCFHVLCQNCLGLLRNSGLTFRCPLCREVPTNVSLITVMPPATQAHQQTRETRPTEATESKEEKTS